MPRWLGGPPARVKCGARPKEVVSDWEDRLRNHYARRVNDVRQLQAHRVPAPDWDYAIQYEAGADHVAIDRALHDAHRDLMCILADQAFACEGHPVPGAARLPGGVAGY
jgi:hypothetical protein